MPASTPMASSDTMREYRARGAASWLLALALGAAAGCGSGGSGSYFVKVGKVTLAEADGVEVPEPGPVIELGPGEGAALPAVPAGAKVVQIAADRDQPYARVRELVLAVQKAGARPVLLVADKGKAMALPHTGAASAQSILVVTEMEGESAKACISPPDAVERQCTMRDGSKHVDRAFVREIVRHAVTGYNLQVVHVKPDEGQSWADAVRAIDGARTCCGKGTRLTLSIEGLEM
jgi:hypothetical protein